MEQIVGQIINGLIVIVGSGVVFLVLVLAAPRRDGI